MIEFIRKVVAQKERIIAGGLIVVASGVAVHFYRQAHAVQNTAQETAQESDRLVAEVGQMMILPDEQPQIATVTNPDALTSDPFFAGAQKGDKLLIFSKARRAILFDPVKHIILNAAPLNTTPAK